MHAFFRTSRARILFSERPDESAREPAYGTPARSSILWTVPSSPTPPWSAFKTTSTCESARAGVAGVPRKCHKPCLSMRISLVSYCSSGSAAIIAAPVFKDNSYSFEVPPRRIPTDIRDIARLYHRSAHSGAVISDGKSMCLRIYEQNILFVGGNEA